MYSIEIPASGGASINNDTEGYGWFTGVATGVLPWRGPIIGFRSAALNDSLCDTNTTGVLAPTTAGRTLDVTSGGNAGIDLDNVTLTNASAAFAIHASGTLNGTHSSTTADLGTNAPSTDISGMTLYVPSRGLARIIDSYNTGTGVATFATTGATLTNGDAWAVFATPQASTTLLAAVDVKKINGTTVIGAGTSGDKWRA